MATINGFDGPQFVRSDSASYIDASTVYATTSHKVDHDMNPALVIQPLHGKDVATAIVHAAEKNVKISVKSGGHQYSGACSTGGNNIMMDLSQTFRVPKQDLTLLPPVNGKTYVRASVSWALGEFNKFLQENKLFIPHGQCSYVHVGGHGQTGGYGQLGRSFGLFGDHIYAIQMYDWAGKPKEVRKDKDPELFYAITGGSPGNLGVITHYDLEVHRDEEVVFGDVRPYAVWVAYPYDPEVLKKMLGKVAEMADNPDFPRNYDLCVSVLSNRFRLDKLGPGKELLTEPNTPLTEPEVVEGQDQLAVATFRAAIIVYAQWVPFSKDDKYDQKWFDDIQNAVRFPRYKKVRVFKTEPMSFITSQWVMRLKREFDLPYEKRTYMTNSTTLTKDKWVDTVTDRIDLVINKKYADPGNALYQNCYLCVQIQCFGGNKSLFKTNANNGTSYSWRDSTVCQVLDCFYKGDSNRAVAEKWQKENDAIMNGPNSSFSKQDKRVLWGSYGDWDLSKNWKFYYEDRAKYERIARTRAAADPKGTFTPNVFSVERLAK